MIPYDKIVKKYGTPSYVYDIDCLLKRVSQLRTIFGPRYDLVYAVKANTFIAKALEKEIDRYEICSPGEFDICNRLSISHQKMVISGVYKEEKILSSMLSQYDDILKYTVESKTQYELLDRLTKKYHRKIHVLLRLTSGNQFGMCEQDIKDLVSHHSSSWITIDGLEYFSGTQKHSMKRIQKEIDTVLKVAEELETDYLLEMQEIEYGPGFPIFYFQGEKFDEEEFFTQVKEILDSIPKYKVTLEVGRSIAASCGSYLTKVVDIKENQYGNYALLDGGIHQLVYYGQTMAMKIPYYERIPKRESKEISYNLCGSLCTINDILVKNLQTPVLEKGDVFIFKNVGAYSSTEGISLFLSRDLPKIILYQNGKTILVRDAVPTSMLNFPNNQ